jgi:hypothetical protein
MEEPSEMTVAELEESLANLRAELEELEEERDFVLKQTGVHLSASEVARFEKETSRLRSQIEAAEQMLRSRKSE